MSKAQSIVGFSTNRAAGDFYPTPPEATHALFTKEKFEGNVLEPACGDGAMSEVIKQYNPVDSSDLYDRGYGAMGIDFLNSGLKEYDNVITNPPYNLAQQFVATSKIVATKKIAMLLKLVFLEGIGRHQMFQDKSFPLKSVNVFCKRIPMYRDGKVGKNSTMIAYAWFIWDKQHQGKPTLDWIK